MPLTQIAPVRLVHPVLQVVTDYDASGRAERQY